MCSPLSIALTSANPDPEAFGATKLKSSVNKSWKPANAQLLATHMTIVAAIIASGRQKPSMVTKAVPRLT